MISWNRYLAYGATAFIVIAIVVVAVFFYKTSPEVISDIPELAQDAEFGGVSLRIEYATTSEARKQGLGGRTEIPDNYGMLFVFPNDDLHGFWMKDTLVPLDIFWLDASAGGRSASGGQELVVVSFMTDVATSSYPNVLYPTVPARYVLETAAGFARVRGIATGTPLRLQKFPNVSQ